MNKELINSSHINKEGEYEWWYFDFVGEDRSAFNIVLHASDIFGIKRGTYYSASALLAGNEKLYLKGRDKDFPVGNFGEYLFANNNYFYENKDIIKFNLHFENGAALTGEIEKTFTPEPINNGVLYESSQGFGVWLPRIINGKFKADLILGGVEKRLKGYAYHDHQCGNLPIQRYISDWIWGHFNGDNEAVVFFKITTQDGQDINRFYVFDGGDEKFGKFPIETSFLKDLATADKPEGANLKAELGLRSASLGFEVSPAGLMRSRINEKVEDKLFTYLRWEADGLLNFKRPLRGVSEYMKFR
ncbi:MAG: hypothetical protein AAB599_01265 [Patescibacteria group bacterium]